jgi:4-diphosphocytidyl-2-C-methyl-D-erythritol kinase
MTGQNSPAPPFTETAYAKINLALHVRRRRDDGYHDLETLFAFLDAGDDLFVTPADADSLTIGGEFAGGLSCGPDNLVLRALDAMRALAPAGGKPIPPLAIHLEKHLPVAAGIGGGSADAAAMVRLLDRHFVHMGDAAKLSQALRHLGADVSACIVSETRIGQGDGSDLHLPHTDDVQGMPLLLVNPCVPLPTGPVFAAWDGVDRGALPTGSALAIARAGRNDLERPALSLCPEIDEVLGVLRAQLPSLSRMSGSGATCFALFPSMDQMQSAAIRIADDHPDYWVMGGQIR